MVRGHRTFNEFQNSGERIATNVLANRLHKLQVAGILTGEREESDGRRINYRLTRKGIDLAPMLLELLIWGARHEDSGLPNAWVMQVAKRRGEFLAEVKRRWMQRDSTPLIPNFGSRKRSAGINRSSRLDENRVTEMRAGNRRARSG
jgi:DNA-binding HxlR family transcriptional regulator